MVLGWFGSGYCIYVTSENSYAWVYINYYEKHGLKTDSQSKWLNARVKSGKTRYPRSESTSFFFLLANIWESFLMVILEEACRNLDHMNEWDQKGDKSDGLDPMKYSVARPFRVWYVGWQIQPTRLTITNSALDVSESCLKYQKNCQRIVQYYRNDALLSESGNSSKRLQFPLNGKINVAVFWRNTTFDEFIFD